MARKPADDKTVASEPKAAAPAPTVEQRLSDLEAAVMAFFVTPVAAGRALLTCESCKAFATRIHRFEHPHSATVYQTVCDACEVRNPLKDHPLAKVTTGPIPNYPEECVELGRRINAARSNVLGRVAP